MVEKVKVPVKNDRPVSLDSKTYADQLNRLTLQFGIGGFSTAGAGLALSAFSGEPVYAACALVLAPLIIASVHFPKKRLQRLRDQQLHGQHATGSSFNVYTAAFDTPPDVRDLQLSELSEPRGTPAASAENINVEGQARHPQLARRPA